MKTQYERNMELINSHDPWGDPADEYYDDMDRVVKYRIGKKTDCFPAYVIYVEREVLYENATCDEQKVDLEEAT